jgi:hypothetical protein
MNREVRSSSSSSSSGLKHLAVPFGHVRCPCILFDDFQAVKHHLGLKIILFHETNEAVVPHDPRRSHPERDVNGFVFTIITAATSTIAIITAATLTINAAQASLPLSSCGTETTFSATDSRTTASATSRTSIGAHKTSISYANISSICIK